MGMTPREKAKVDAANRRERIITYMQQDPPVTLCGIATMEGMAERACRLLIKEIEAETGLTYGGSGVRRDPDELPHGLSAATNALRSYLAGELYTLREKGNRGKSYSRAELAPLIGLNPRSQIRAVNKPFTHDWKLSEIERLAWAMGRDPLELLTACLKN